MAKILIADDDLASGENMILVLEGEGHEVFAVSVGQEALDVVETEEPDMVFLALSTPILSGLEVCELIQNDPTISPDLPVVLLFSSDVDTRAVHRAGAADMLSKSHSVNDLRDMLVKHLGPKAVP